MRVGRVRTAEASSARQQHAKPHTHTHTQKIIRGAVKAANCWRKCDGRQRTEHATPLGGQRTATRQTAERTRRRLPARARSACIGIEQRGALARHVGRREQRGRLVTTHLRTNQLRNALRSLSLSQLARVRSAQLSVTPSLCVCADRAATWAVRARRGARNAPPARIDTTRPRVKQLRVGQQRS